MPGHGPDPKVRRQEVVLESPSIGRQRVVVYGDYGRPVLVFPPSRGRATDYEDHGMVDAVRPLLHSGRAKLYCVDGFDAGSWWRQDLPLADRARLHRDFERWVVDQVVPFVYDDCAGPQEILTTGCSFGAYHAVTFALRRADLFPVTIGHSGVYDVGVVGWGDGGDELYYVNPLQFVPGLSGSHLDWLRERLTLVLTVGRGMWEDTTGSLESTRAFAAVCAERGLHHELDVWGPETPHDWVAWREQLAKHLPRFC